MRSWRNLLIVTAVLLGFSGCATVKGWVGRGEGHGDKAAVVEEAAPAEAASGEDPEISLRRVVEREIAAADHQSAADPDKLVRRKPYWMKEYVEYPENANNLQIELQETESRTRPYIADVKVAKTRYSTRLHRERTAAAEDSNFLRDTGEETLTYEFRGGHWVRTGSLFVADTTEEKVAGNWQPVQEEPERAEPEQEQPKGFIDRTFGWVLGR